MYSSASVCDDFTDGESLGLRNVGEIEVSRPQAASIHESGDAPLPVLYLFERMAGSANAGQVAANRSSPNSETSPDSRGRGESCFVISAGTRFAHAKKIKMSE